MSLLDQIQPNPTPAQLLDARSLANGASLTVM